ncbi:MAG: 50S ribosomal protein L1 [Candidatus Anstonellaceae archaeon]
MDKKEALESIKKLLGEYKGKRKFVQSVEAIINFKGVNFSKPENRLNLDIVLPKGKGKKNKVVVFADGQIALDAKKAGAEEVFSKEDIERLKKDKKTLKKLANKYEFLAVPHFMVDIGKNLGQVLSTRGKLPRPIIGSVENSIKQARDKIRITNKGSYLPTVQFLIGNEDMTPEDLVENLEAVYEKIKEKIGGAHLISSIYIKLTMSPPIKLKIDKKGEKK